VKEEEAAYVYASNNATETDSTPECLQKEEDRNINMCSF
jgi:hypothetical protein